jgi:hypothetical protein
VERIKRARMKRKKQRIEKGMKRRDSGRSSGKGERLRDQQRRRKNSGKRYNRGNEERK